MSFDNLDELCRPLGVLLQQLIEACDGALFLVLVDCLDKQGACQPHCVPQPSTDPNRIHHHGLRPAMPAAASTSDCLCGQLPAFTGVWPQEEVSLLYALHIGLG